MKFTVFTTYFLLGSVASYSAADCCEQPTNPWLVSTWCKANNYLSAPGCNYYKWTFLAPNTCIFAGQKEWRGKSAGRDYDIMLSFQGDGNLVFYTTTKARFSSGTANSGYKLCAAQKQLIVYRRDGTVAKVYQTSQENAELFVRHDSTYANGVWFGTKLLFGEFQAAFL